MTLKSLLTPLLLVSLPLATAAHAQAPNCGPRETMTMQLLDKFGEVSHGAGIANEKNLIEFWSSQNGTWTILSTNVNGRSCIIATGKDWTDNPAFATAFDPTA